MSKRQEGWKQKSRGCEDRAQQGKKENGREEGREKGRRKEKGGEKKKGKEGLVAVKKERMKR